MNEQIHFDPTAQPYNTSKTDPVGFALGAGIFFFPYFFAWLLLRKNKNYSKTVKLLSFGWMIVLGATFLLPKSTTPTATEQLPPIPAQSASQTAAPIAPTVPTKLEKPTTPRNPNYIERLSAAIAITGPSEADKLEQAWDDYDQQECTSTTLASDKKKLKLVQTMRLNHIEQEYKFVVRHNLGDAIAAMRAAQAVKLWANADKPPARLIYALTPCLAKNGNISNEATDLNNVKSLLMMTFAALKKAHDSKYKSDDLAEFDKQLKNYMLYSAIAKSEIAKIK